MISSWSLFTSSAVALAGIALGAAASQAVIGDPVLRGDSLEETRRLPSGISLTGPSLAARANELLGADVSRLINQRQVKNANRIMLQNVAFQRDVRAIYCDFSILDMVPGRSLIANLDMYDDNMVRIASQPLSFVSSGSSQTLRIMANPSPSATRFSVRITDSVGTDIALFSSSDASDQAATVPPDLPLFASDRMLAARLIAKLGFVSPDLVISGQALQSVINDFRSLTEMDDSSPFPTLRDLYALRALAGETGEFDISGYYDWRLSSENLRAPRPRAEASNSASKNGKQKPSSDDVVVEEDVTASIEADDEISF